MNLKKGGKRLENFDKAYRRAKDKQRRAIKKAAAETGLSIEDIRDSQETMHKLSIPYIPEKKDLKKAIESGSVKHYNAQMKLLTAYTDKNADEIITRGRGKTKVTATKYEFQRFEAEKKLIIESHNAFIEELQKAAEQGNYKGYNTSKESILEKIESLQNYIDDLKGVKFNEINQTKFDIIRESADKQVTREYNDTLRHKHIRVTMTKDWEKNFGKAKAKKLIAKAEEIGWDTLRTLQIGGVEELEWVFPYVHDESPEAKNDAFSKINDVLDKVLNYNED